MGKVYDFPDREPPEMDAEADDSESVPPFNLGVLLGMRAASILRHPTSHQLGTPEYIDPDLPEPDATPPLA